MARKSNKKKNKKVTIIGRVIFGILILLSVVFFGIVLLLGAVPSKYLVPVIVIYCIYLFVSYICQCRSDIKNGIKYFFDFISCIVIMILCMGIFYMYKTMNFMDIIKSKGYELENYYVIVLKSEYDSLSNLNNKYVGVYSSKDNYIRA